MKKPRTKEQRSPPLVAVPVTMTMELRPRNLHPRRRLNKLAQAAAKRAPPAMRIPSLLPKRELRAAHHLVIAAAAPIEDWELRNPSLFSVI